MPKGKGDQRDLGVSLSTLLWEVPVIILKHSKREMNYSKKSWNNWFQSFSDAFLYNLSFDVPKIFHFIKSL